MGTKLQSQKENQDLEMPISLALFDELGLAERSIYNPLIVLHILYWNMMEKTKMFVSLVLVIIHQMMLR